MCVNNLNITCKLSEIIEALRKIRDYNRYHYVRPQKVANFHQIMVPTLDNSSSSLNRAFCRNLNNRLLVVLSLLMVTDVSFAFFMKN